MQRTIVETQCECVYQGSFDLTYSNFIVGQLYFLLLDGCAGDICDYEIAVLSGSTIAVPPQTPGSIIGNTVVNPGTTTVYTIPNANTASFFWTISPSDVGILSNPNSPSVDIQWQMPGTVNLCVTASNPCESNPIPSCVTITYQNPLPSCTNLNSPVNGSTNVDINADLSWTVPSGSPTGYKLTIGTTPNGGEILNNVDVGNVTNYEPGTLPSYTTIYVKIIPYNNSGEAVGCEEESFETGNCNLIPEITWIVVYHVWDLPQNWSLGYVPNSCNEIIIPSGIVLVPLNVLALGKTLEVQFGATLEVPLGSIMNIE